MYISHVKRTSSAVRGVPSCHIASGCSSTVAFKPAGSTSIDFASHSTGSTYSCQVRPIVIQGSVSACEPDPRQM